MAKSIVLTASGIVKAGAGALHGVNITKVATGAGVVRIWDSPSAAAGTKLFEGDGLSSQSYSTQSFGSGTGASTGLYCELAGTTNATVTVIFD